MPKKPNKEYGFDTHCIHAGHDVLETKTITPPIYQSVAYPYESAEYAAELFRYEREGFMYGRMDNPTNQMFEERLAAVELTEKALATGSGMSAIFMACIHLMEKGEGFVTSSKIYGGSNKLFTQTLPRLGFEPIFVKDSSSIENWSESINNNTKFLYVETPSNPNLFVADIPELAKLAHEHNLPLVVDNTVASPALQQPVSLGADIIVHSATKYLSGNSSCISGVVAGSADFIDNMREQDYRNIGPSISPFNSWLLLLGMETLSLRMDKHSQNAQAIAEFLEDHSKVESVLYPGLTSHSQHELAKKQLKGYSGLLSFVTKGELVDSKNVIDAFDLIIHTGHLGTTKTLATHPAFTTHQQLTQEERLSIGIPDTMIRMSIGLENIDDLIEDMDHALTEIK
ncbi:MAG: O-acetylhomoserine aminocarboxypropyltransferase/cysteine synthase family protein [Candidatus Heimdallarchaeaceae archaeon]